MKNKIDLKWESENLNIWIMLQSITPHICHCSIQQRHSNLSQRYSMQFPLNTHRSFKNYPLIENDISRVFLIREKECGSLFAISTLLSFLWQHITLSDMWLANEGKKATSVKNLQNRSFLDTKKTSNMFIVYSMLYLVTYYFQT